MSKEIDHIVEKGRNIITYYKDGTRRVQRKPEGESRTKQSEKNNCDINRIVSKAMAGGLAPIQAGNPMFEDFTQVTNFQDAKNLVKEAENSFNELPSQIRKACKNDPSVFMQLVNDPEGLDRMVMEGVMLPPDNWVHPKLREATAASEAVENDISAAEETAE